MKKNKIIAILLLLTLIGSLYFLFNINISLIAFQQPNQKEVDLLSISGLSDPYHVTSITERGATGPEIENQLKYDDGVNYNIRRITSSQLEYFDSFASTATGKLLNPNQAYSGNPHSAMLTKNDGNYYTHNYWGHWFCRAITAYQTFTVNLGSSWTDNFYMTGYKVDFRMSWSIGNDVISNSWSKFEIYAPNAQYPFEPGWSWVVENPLVVNTWTDSCIERDDYPYDHNNLNFYIDSNGVIKFRFVEYTKDLRWLQNPEIYLKWDYWKLTIYCLDRNNNDPCVIEFHFADAILDGETLYNVYFQGGPEICGSIYSPTIIVVINEGEFYHAIVNTWDTREFYNIAVEKIEISLQLIDGYHFAFRAQFDYFYLREVT